MNTDEKINDFLDRICLWLPTKRLKARTRREFREHIEDGIDFYAEKGLPQKEAAERMLKEMGDPFEINKELRKAHRGLLWLARFRNAVAVILIICIIAAFPPQFKNFLNGMSGKKIEESIRKRESFVLDDRTETDTVKLLFEYKNEDGKTFRVYETDNGFTYLTQSVEFFGINLPHRFVYPSSIDFNDKGVFISHYVSVSKSNKERCVYLGFKALDFEQKFVRIIYVVTEADGSEYEKAIYTEIPREPCVLEIVTPEKHTVKSVDICNEKQEVTD